MMTEPAPEDDPRAAAMTLARGRVAAEAAALAVRARAKTRRSRMMKVVIVGMFVVMAFERAVSSGWFQS